MKGTAIAAPTPATPTPAEAAKLATAALAKLVGDANAMLGTAEYSTPAIFGQPMGLAHKGIGTDPSKPVLLGDANEPVNGGLSIAFGKTDGVAIMYLARGRRAFGTADGLVFAAALTVAGLHSLYRAIVKSNLRASSRGWDTPADFAAQVIPDIAKRAIEAQYGVSIRRSHVTAYGAGASAANPHSPVLARAGRTGTAAGGSLTLSQVLTGE